jgi:hypothetical protein
VSAAEASAEAGAAAEAAAASRGRAVRARRGAVAVAGLGPGAAQSYQSRQQLQEIGSREQLSSTASARCSSQKNKKP